LGKRLENLEKDLNYLKGWIKGFSRGQANAITGVIKEVSENLNVQDGKKKPEEGPKYIG
jgi:hypothetical protein